MQPILKAFVLCEDVTEKPDSPSQVDLKGAGLSVFQSDGSFPHKVSFWVFIQMAAHEGTGQVNLALVRADSGRRYYFRDVTVRHEDPVLVTPFCVRLYDIDFPDRGVYFIELWYDGEWLLDQRLEVM